MTTPGVKSFTTLSGGPPAGKAISIKVRGDDFDTIQAAADDLKAIVASIEGTKDVQDDNLPGRARLQLQLDHAALREAGLNAAQVARIVRLADDGEVVAFTRGDAGLAVQASSAIVGRLAPVRIGGVRYVDADQRLPLPVRLARGLGASRVLAVDASAHEDRAPAAAARYRDIDLRKRALTQPDARVADVLLHPDTGYWAGWSRAYRERLIAAGEAAVHAQAARLVELHGGSRSARMS